MLSFWENGTIPWLASGAVNQRRITTPSKMISKEGFAASSTKWIPAGSIVIALAGQGRTKGMCATVEIAMTGNQSLAFMTPNPDFHDYRFVAYAVESQYLDIRGSVGTDLRNGLNLDNVKNIVIANLGLEDQKARVRYLDHSEIRIAKAIQAKQKMVALLNEQKQVIISELVTHGLNPDVEMKDSGVLGLGDIPASWDLVRAKSIWRPVVSRSQTGLEQLLSVSSKFGPVPRKNINVTMFMASSYVGHKRVRVNDLVINSLWSWAYGLGVSKHEGLVSTAYSVFELINPSVADPDYMNYLLRSVPMQWQFQVSSKGIWKSRLQLTDSSFGSFTLLLPPIEEQKLIASSVVNETRSIENAISTVEREIELLKEYRTVLISDVVTGKKDVRAEAADLLDVDPAELAHVLSGALIGNEEEDEVDGTSEVE
jgi:type I restriction enzyme S subunit